MSTSNDEIDLFDLARGVWIRKWLVAAITAVTVAIALVYNLSATLTYRAEIFVRPPDRAQLSSINEIGVFSMTPDEAFQKGFYELESMSVKQAVYDAIGRDAGDESDGSALTLQDFVASVSVKLPATRKNTIQTKDYAIVSITSQDAVFAANAANIMVDYANRNGVLTLQQELKESVAAQLVIIEERMRRAIEVESMTIADRITRIEEGDRIETLNLTDKIDALRAKNLMLRKDQIEMLREALALAVSLDITIPTTFSQFGSQNQEAKTNVAISADLDGNEQPLFLRGTRMLKAEINALQNRKSDDFTSIAIRDLEQQLAELGRNREVEQLRGRENIAAFVDGIEELRSEAKKLKSFIDQDYSGIRLLKIDYSGEIPADPIAPNKKLILLLAGFFGGLLGVFVALFSYLRTNRKE
ncbi:Wzz/FepE/Etk N-terminal domain-containing protein [bacterium]|nr:Wzz/FepE/Etk N-terminal domain-containing protein [bacterium]